MGETNDSYHGKDSVVYRVDSVRIQDIDSVFVLIRGDTVFKYKYEYRYRDRVRIDSFFVRDTIKETTNTMIEVPAQLSKTQQRAITSGYLLWILLIILTLFLIYKLIKR